MAISRKGFGQVEPNHLSGQVTGQIFAQLPCKEGIDQLENGQFAYYNEFDKVVQFEAEDSKGNPCGEALLVFNEVKLYDGWKQQYKDFVWARKDFFDNELYARLIKINVGDSFTTNTLIGANTDGEKDFVMFEEFENEEAAREALEGEMLTINADGFLELGDGDYKIVKVYNMPDMQFGVKVMKVK